MANDKPIIKATTPKSSKYDTKIDVYTSLTLRDLMNQFI